MVWHLYCRECFKFYISMLKELEMSILLLEELFLADGTEGKDVKMKEWSVRRLLRGFYGFVRFGNIFAIIFFCEYAMKI